MPPPYPPGAVALSNSATLAALIGHLRRIGAVSAEAERDIYENALQMLEEGQGDDYMLGVFPARQCRSGTCCKMRKPGGGTTRNLPAAATRLPLRYVPS